MKTPRLPRARVLVPTLAAVAVLGAGGAFWATSASADDHVTGDRRDQVAAAAEKAAGGTATEVEHSDDRGTAYEVEVRLEDGSEFDVELDEDLAVLRQDQDDDTDDRDDDRALTDTERTSAEEAALEAVGSGTVTDVEAEDAGSYSVEVRADDGTEWEVDLDADFEVLDKHVDD
ncbi:PepSY domain-containing protein [Nocardioides campestrisoli]|uniref:PepSY domain-containing protein n=1 Tax=Nocardioides campestrisoli TaxID=2736757 RepID=UPI00163D4392|nr:PepSY domain-containing protein [Nocardioides campestrisoli]